MAPIYQRLNDVVQSVDYLVDVMLRGVDRGSQEVMKRMKRWLRRIFFAAGVQDASGNHLGLHKALILTNPQDTEFDTILTRVGPYLPRQYLADFKKLRSTRGAQQQEKWVESSINGLDDLLSDVTELILGQFAPESLDQQEIILGSHIQIVNLRQSDDLSRDVGNKIGGMIVSAVIAAARRIADQLPEDRRVPHFLIIDEAEYYVGEDLRSGFGELRKFKLSLVIAIQDLSCLEKGELSLVGKVVSQCRFKLSFHQADPEGIKYLGEMFGLPALSFDPLLKREVIPDGYDFVLLPSVSQTEGASYGESSSVTASHTCSTSRGRTEAQSINEAVSRALSLGHNEGSAIGITGSHSDGKVLTFNHSEGFGASQQNTQSLARGTSQSDTRGDSVTNSNSNSFGQRMPDFNGVPIDVNDNRSNGTALSQNSSTSSGTTQSSTLATGNGTTQSENDGTSIAFSNVDTMGKSMSISQANSIVSTSGTTQGKATSVAETNSQSTADAVASGQTRSAGTSNGTTHGLAVAPLARHRFEWADTGSLKVSVQDQLFMVMQRLATLPPRVALCICGGVPKPFLLTTHDLLDPWEEWKKLGKIERIPSPEFRTAAFQTFLDSVFASHGYNFVPDQAPNDASSEVTGNGHNSELVGSSVVRPTFRCVDSNGQDVDQLLA